MEAAAVVVVTQGCQTVPINAGHANICTLINYTITTLTSGSAISPPSRRTPGSVRPSGRGAATGTAPPQCGCRAGGWWGR